MDSESIKQKAHAIKTNMSYKQYFIGFFDALYWLTLGYFHDKQKCFKYYEVLRQV